MNVKNGSATRLTGDNTGNSYVAVIPNNLLHITGTALYFLCPKMQHFHDTTSTEISETIVPEWSANGPLVTSQPLICSEQISNLSKSTIMISVIDHCDTTATADYGPWLHVMQVGSRSAEQLAELVCHIIWMTFDSWCNLPRLDLLNYRLHQ